MKKTSTRTCVLIFLASALALVCLCAVVELLPIGRNHSNPPVSAEPQWDSPRTRELARRACFDCHSNETVWPWYSNIAPVSWSVQHHVDEGRAILNFSEWDRPQEEAHEAAEKVAEGEMPIGQYLLMHPEAKLSAQEKADLIAGLQATLGGEGSQGSEGEGD
jgi:hypothetical protein